MNVFLNISRLFFDYKNEKIYIKKDKFKRKYCIDEDDFIKIHLPWML